MSEQIQSEIIRDALTRKSNKNDNLKNLIKERKRYMEQIGYTRLNKAWKEKRINELEKEIESIIRMREELKELKEKRLAVG